ncbi:fibroblast growth factor-binding protein 1 isoform X2 [Hoplias malabaricus]|uniref:fibroblast growth factor-binding protein 1 isoform X2 n=1 Tax=Hoplias malabaricus TaxID=27720 RepID=UPI003461E714
MLHNNWTLTEDLQQVVPGSCFAICLSVLCGPVYGCSSCSERPPPAAMRPPAIPCFFFLFLFLCFLPFLEAAKKKTKAKGEDEGPTAPVGPSGELSTKEGHRCTWETQEGRNSNILLLVKCSVPGEMVGVSRDSYSCQFSGKPQECPAYGDKPAQYWKQVVGKLKKRTNACEGEKLLKTRQCKRAPSAAHMKLTEKKVDGQIEGSKKRSGNKDGEKEKEKEKQMKEEGDELMQGDTIGFGEVNDGTNSEASETFCREGWSTFCHFFTKLLDG